MGVGLRLIPTWHKLKGEDIGLTVLRLELFTELHDMMTEVPAYHVGKGRFRSFFGTNKDDEDGEHRWGDMDEDAYGDPLMYAVAFDLSNCLIEYKKKYPDHHNFENTAAQKYLSALPPDWPVVMYWE